jgi:hypothetical protein
VHRSWPGRRTSPRDHHIALDSQASDEWFGWGRPLGLRVGCPLICSAYMPLAQTRVARWETDVLHTSTLTSLVCSPCAFHYPLQLPCARLWITLSAKTRRDGGIVIPRALAVLRLRTSSNLMGCSTGRSAGLGSFMILST